MEGKNSNTILLTVIGVATLLVALVGATFAYFSATVSNSSAQSVKVTTAKAVTLEYVGGVATLTNAIPGAHSDTNAFTVTYPKLAAAGDVLTYYYDLVFVVDTNGFTKTPAVSDGQTHAADQLFVTISGAGITSKEINLTDGTTAQKAGTATTIATHIAITGSATAAVTQSYNLKVEFRETGENQNENQNKSFVGHVEVRNVTSATA